MENRRMFVEKILKQCAELNVRCLCMWQFAQWVFCALITGVGMEDKYIFFINPNNVVERERSKMTMRGAHLIQLKKPDCYFKLDGSVRAFTIGNIFTPSFFIKPDNTLRNLPLIFVAPNGEEIVWLKEPEEIILDFSAKTTRRKVK